MKTKLLITLLSAINLSAFSQPQFQLAIGGSLNDQSSSLVQSADGGYAVCGFTRSYGGSLNKFYILKLNASGSIEWTRTVGGQEGYSIKQTMDGGYAVAGLAFYVVKLDAGGLPQWTRNVGGSNAEQSYSIIQTTDSGYAAAGFGFNFGWPDILVVRLDVNGNFRWCSRVGGTIDDRGFSIVQSTDGGFVIAGITTSFGAGLRDYYVVKLDSIGALQWSKTIGGTGDEGGNFDIMSIIPTTGGGYILAGFTSSFGAGQQDFYIVKLDGSGTLQWTRTIGGTGAECAYSVIQTRDGGYAAAGYTNSFGAGNSDIFIVKLDNSGSLVWSKTVGGTNSEGAGSIIQISDGSFVVAGTTNSFGSGNNDIYVVKLDSNGNTCANSTSPPCSTGTGGAVTTPTPTVNSITPTFTAPTPTLSSGGTVTSICGTVGIQPVSNEIPGAYKLYQNYPNPFNPKSNIKYHISNTSKVILSVFDVLGHEIYVLVNQEQEAGSYEVTWDATNYPSGVYYYKLSTADLTDTKKMILIK